MAISQCERIVRHLKDHGSITSMEAMNEYGIMRLASRINDLRSQGIPIVVETVSGKNRFGEKIFYARYKLTEDTWEEERCGYADVPACA